MNTRYNTAWGLTKAAGLFLLWNALDYFFSLLQNTLLLSAAMPADAMAKSSSVLAGFVVEGFISGVLGIYLLVSGRILMMLMGQTGDPE